MIARLMPDLPAHARLYVGTVIVLGGLVFAAAMPPPLERPGLLAMFVAMGAIAAGFKIRLPLYKGGSTLSISFAFDFAGLLLLPLPEAMTVAAISAFAQCTFNRTEHYPAYRTIFSIATVIVTVAISSAAFHALGGSAAFESIEQLVVPVMTAGIMFFVVNSLLVGIAISLSIRESLRRVWYENLFWSLPGYVVGALVSAGFALLILEYGYIMAPAVFIPAYLIYRAYEVYVARIEIEQQHVRQISELHQATMEALALARASEQALAAEKERLAVTLRSIGDGVITTDTAGRVLLLNQVAEQLTGWRQDTAAGQPLEDVFPILDRETSERLDSPIDRVLRSDESAEHGSTAALEIAGQRSIVEWRAAPMRDGEGVIMGVVLVLRDVTSEIRVEEERAKSSKLESLGILAGGIAHDFNNIMTAIVGNLSLVSMSPDLDTTTAKRISEAERACQRAKSLTKQLLTFSKGGAPVKAPVVLPPVVEDAARFALRGSNVRVEFEMASDLWMAEADAGQLTQVINNVVLNAKQAMPDGGVVRVTARNVARRPADASLPAGDYVHVSVADRGKGIPAHILSKVFDPYFTTKADGSGLGLASSYSIIRNHGGHIGLESVVGVGTTVDILIPRTTASLRAVPAPSRDSGSSVKGRILIMDDEEAIRELASEMLQCLGYESALTADGEEALRVYTEAADAGERFDVVIMDLTIPGGMGGKEAISRLRLIDPDVKAIVSSGYADDPVMADHVAYGFHGVVAKPYTIKDLGRALETLLREREAVA